MVQAKTKPIQTSTFWLCCLCKISLLCKKNWKPAIFVGYGRNGYRLWNEDTRRIFMARDVVFTNKLKPRTIYRTGNEINIPKYNNIDEQNTAKSLSEKEDEPNQIEEQIPQTQHSPPEEKSNSEDLEEILHHPHSPPENMFTDEMTETQIVRPPETEDLSAQKRYSLRYRSTCKMPSKFDDYILDLSSDEEANMSYVLDFSVDKEANLTFNNCINDYNWFKAIQDEKNSLNKNQVWKLVDRAEAKGHPIITSRWIFKIKDNGTYKARLVARGFQQRSEHLEYEDTFSPVVDFSNLRVLFALAARSNSKLISFDVKTAFLNEILEDKVYMQVPEGYHEPGKVCHLKKALYGLKQASQRWYKRLATFLTQENYTHIKVDKCIWKNSSGTVLLAIHVDDGIIVSSDEVATNNLLKKLKIHFEITVDLSPTSYLGIQISRSDQGICLHQTSYATQLLEKYEMSDCRSVPTPMDFTKQKKDHPSPRRQNPQNYPYRQIVGSLLYLSNKTRPDLSFSVNNASRYVSNPTAEDIIKIKRILRYLKATVDLGIFYSSQRTPEMSILRAFSDSDYAQTGLITFDIQRRINCRATQR